MLQRKFKGLFGKRNHTSQKSSLSTHTLERDLANAFSLKPNKDEPWGLKMDSRFTISTCPDSKTLSGSICLYRGKEFDDDVPSVERSFGSFDDDSISTVSTSTRRTPETSANSKDSMSSIQSIQTTTFSVNSGHEESKASEAQSYSFSLIHQDTGADADSMTYHDLPMDNDSTTYYSLEDKVTTHQDSDNDDLSFMSLDSKASEQITSLQNRLRIQEETKLQLIHQLQERMTSNLAGNNTSSAMYLAALKRENNKLREQNSKIEKEFMDKICLMETQLIRQQYELCDKDDRIAALEQEIAFLKLSSDSS